MVSLNNWSTRATAWWCDSALRWTILDFKAGAPFGSTRRLLRDPASSYRTVSVTGQRTFDSVDVARTLKRPSQEPNVANSTA